MPRRRPGAFIRVERQTLQKAAQRRAISCSRSAFISTRWAADRAGRTAQALAASFAELRSALDMEQLDYKGLTADRDRLVEALRGHGRA